MIKAAAAVLIAWPLLSQGDAQWRYFTSQDGLAESWVGSVSVGPSGRIWITHGEIGQMSVSDGFTVQRIPSPGPNLKVLESPDGEVWALVQGTDTRFAGLQQLRGARDLLDVVPAGDAPAAPPSPTRFAWVPYSIPELQELPTEPDPLIRYYHRGNAFAPAGSGKVLIALPGRVVEFDAATRTLEDVLPADTARLGPFTGIRTAREGGFWISAEHGLAKVESGPDGYRWSVSPLPGRLGARRLTRLFEGVPGRLTATVVLAGGVQAVVEFASGQWRLLARNSSPGQQMTGWSGFDDGYWTLRRRGLSRSLAFTVGNFVGETPISKVLSGDVHDLAADARGVFWVATRLGLARFAPSTWRPPPKFAGDDSLFVSIAEDRTGRLYVLQERAISFENQGRWFTVPLPEELDVAAMYSGSLIPLADGSLGVGVMEAGALKPMVFHAATANFTLAPPGRGTFVRKRSGGRAWILAGSRRRIEVYSLEGSDAVHVLTIPERFQTDWPRTIEETRDGAIWIGGPGSDSLLRFKDGQLEAIGSEHGYTLDGTFFLLELRNGHLWSGGRDAILAWDGRNWTAVGSGFETIRSMLEAADGSIWVASGTGLHRFRNGSWVHMGSTEGVPDAAGWSLFEDSRGRLWAGTSRGLRLFYPEADAEPPRAFVPEESNPRDVPPSGNVHLTFRAQDRWRFTPDDRLLFSFRLDDGVWSEFAPQNVAALTDLPSGRHRIWVRAMDRNFNIGETETPFEFKVLVAWYLQPVFLGTCGIALVLFGLIVRGHVRSHIELERLVAQRTSELEDANLRLVEDIRRRERAEKVLRETEERLQSILDNSEALIFVKDIEGRYLLVNRRWKEVFGMAPEEVAGKTDADFQPPEIAAAWRENDNKVLAAGRPFQVEEEVQLGQETRYYLSTKCPLWKPDGEPYGICAVSTDITEHKKLEEQLRQAQKMEAVGTLAGGVAHDFNNLLTVISGFCQLALMDLSERDPLRVNLEHMQKASDRAAELTRQLLAFSRRQMLQPKVLDLNRIVTEMTPMLRRVIPESIELRLQTTEEPLPVLADQAQIEQVLMNLVINARDAMQGSGTLQIRTTRQGGPIEDGSAPEVYAVLSVIDSGCGMSEEVLARIFEPFFTTKGPDKGTGLGLATAYGIVKQSGGDIRVESEPGAGSRFDVLLRLVSDPVVPASSSSPEQVSRDRRARLLVVEDDPRVRSLVREVLRNAGFEIEEAASGEEALRVAFRLGIETFDLLVSDIVMPRMNGPELTRLLREKRPDLRVLFISGYSEDTIKHPLPEGTNLLGKPFGPRELEKAVRAMLEVTGPAPGGDRASAGKSR
jgi:PAS domain S-box-containing protein